MTEAGASLMLPRAGRVGDPMARADPRGLDNPYWSCLATRHAHISRGGALARRYPPDISPIAGLPGAEAANVAALTALVDVGDDIGLVGPYVPALPENWETLHASQLTQMLRRNRSPLPEGDAEVMTLGPADVDEMLELVERTRPGPFRRRTIELGTYIGIRERGRLVAMAGERTWIGDYREVSAICTQPEAQGRGYARALIGRVVNRMLRADQTPYLHVESSNARAIKVYLSLGFVRRTEFAMLRAKRLR
jgi:ribosomal protein S18 acetylase RimI-like enzyme